MLITAALLLSGVFRLHAQVTLSIVDTPLTDAIVLVERACAVSVFYSSELPDKDARVNVNVVNGGLHDVMGQLLSGLDIAWSVQDGNQILLAGKGSAAQGVRTPSVPFTVKGRVVDSSGAPVIGAGVLYKDGRGAVSDMDGFFELDIDERDAVLKVISMGYRDQEIRVSGRPRIEVRLEEELHRLDESVVVGYGVQKKVNLTGSVAMISAEEMSSRPVSNMVSGIQGLLPGVTVVNVSGQPGQSNTTIRVRGIGTLGNANPLILVDGVEGDLSSLNPDDIESISVLKDAASSAIYGARAANGVLLVTTKNISVADKMTSGINYGAYVGFQTPTRLPRMCNAIDFMNLDNEARLNIGVPPAWTESDFEKVRTGSAPNYFADTDWLGAVLLKAAPQHNHTLTVNGKVGDSGYMISYRYLDQHGLTAGQSTGEIRHNIRMKLNTQVLDRVTLAANMGYTSSKVTAPVNSLTNGSGAIYNAMRIAPNAPIYYTDGTWAYGGGNTNPLAVLKDGGRSLSETNHVSLQGMAKIAITQGWDLTATYNVTNIDGLREVLRKTILFLNPEDGSSYAYASPNSLRNRDTRSDQQTFILQTNYNFSRGRHNFSGVAGFSQEWSRAGYFEASRSNLITESNPTLNLGDPSTMGNDADASGWAIRSGFGRASYNFAERYLAEVNLRYDLSSRFHKDSRGGLFPSFSAGWRLTEETFMKPVKKYFDNIKLRASWGMLGNQYVGSSDYPYLSVLEAYTSGISLIGTNATTAYVQSTLSNPGLTWEKIKMLDVGIDLVMLGDRLLLSFDWYDKKTEDILLKLNYPAQIGAEPSERNAGKVGNRGWELDLGWREQRGAVYYSLNFNLSDVRNKIIDLAGNSPDLSSYQIRMPGYPIDAFYGYRALGLMMGEDFRINDPENGIYSLPAIPVVMGNTYQPGDIKYKDISGPDGVPDGRITPEYDRTVIGSNIPRYTYSARGDLRWKGLDFSVLLQGVGKCDGYLTGSARHALQDMAAYPQKVHLQRFNVVSNPDPNAPYPRLTYNNGFNQNTFSTYWLEDASYLRLKNLQLGYTLPEKLTEKARIKKLRIYFSGDNLATFSNFFYAFDPEVPVTSGGYYPQVKTFVFGIDLLFR